MAQTEYLVIVEKHEDGAYGAYVPELPGIGVEGGRKVKCVTWSPRRSGCISTSSNGVTTPVQSRSS